MTQEVLTDFENKNYNIEAIVINKNSGFRRSSPGVAPTLPPMTENIQPRKCETCKAKQGITKNWHAISVILRQELKVYSRIILKGGIIGIPLKCADIGSEMLARNLIVNFYIRESDVNLETIAGKKIVSMSTCKQKTHHKLQCGLILHLWRIRLPIIRIFLF